MEKRKFDMSNYADMHKEETFEGIDGTKVTVRDHIPYESKNDMARELIERTLVVHDDSCVYTSNEYEKYKIYLVVKYYTDIDTEEADVDDVVNYMINTNVIERVLEFVDKDLEYVTDMFWDLFNALNTVYTDDNSLAKAVRKSFGFLFNGEDITETLARAEDIKDKTFKAFDLLRQAEQDESKNIEDGKMTIGGNIINFAKKDE